MSEHARWLIGTAIALLGVVIALFAWLDPKAPLAAAPNTSSAPAAVVKSPKPSPKPTPKVTARNVGLDDVQVGECLAGPGVAKIISSNFNSWPDTAEVVPCNAGHVAEVFFAGNNLSEAQVNNQLTALCDSAFKAYVGVSASNSIYTYWASSGGSSAQCIAFEYTTTKPGYTALDRSIKGTRQ